MFTCRYESPVFECPLLNDGMAVVRLPGGVQPQQQQQTRTAQGFRGGMASMML